MQIYEAARADFGCGVVPKILEELGAMKTAAASAQKDPAQPYSGE